MRCFTRTTPLSCQGPRTLRKCISLLYFPLTVPYWGRYERYGVDFGHFRLKLGMCFFHSRIELGRYVFEKKLLFHH